MFDGEPIDVAPFTGAWIEIIRFFRCYINSSLSHPSRVRGLKLSRVSGKRGVNMLSHPSRVRGLKSAWKGNKTSGSQPSHPSRVRGLKYTLLCTHLLFYSRVAPFTGAWIEIKYSVYNIIYSKVAPFTGAWIEINNHIYYYFNIQKSHPSRVRGLKYIELRPHAFLLWSHPSRVRGLKYL